MIAWVCEKCGKSGITRWFKPRWVKEKLSAIPVGDGGKVAIVGYYHEDWRMSWHIIWALPVKCGDVVMTKRAILRREPKPKPKPEPKPKPKPKPEPVKRTCGNCMFHRKRPKRLEKDFVECHKNSPHPDSGENLADQSRAIWPAVRTWEDCGGHEFVGGS